MTILGWCVAVVVGLFLACVLACVLHARFSAVWRLSRVLNDACECYMIGARIAKLVQSEGEEEFEQYCKSTCGFHVIAMTGVCSVLAHHYMSVYRQSAAMSAARVGRIAIDDLQEEWEQSVMRLLRSHLRWHQTVPLLRQMKAYQWWNHRYDQHVDLSIVRFIADLGMLSEEMENRMSLEWRRMFEAVRGRENAA